MIVCSMAGRIVRASSRGHRVSEPSKNSRPKIWGTHSKNNEGMRCIKLTHLSQFTPGIWNSSLSAMSTQTHTHRYVQKSVSSPAFFSYTAFYQSSVCFLFHYTHSVMWNLFMNMIGGIWWGTPFWWNEVEKSKKCVTSNKNKKCSAYKTWCVSFIYAHLNFGICWE